MGQCMSRKAAGAFAASAAAAHNRPGKMHKNAHLQSPGEDDKTLPKKSPQALKGVATSFGFKRRPPTVAANANAARRLANVGDSNGNDDATPLMLSPAPTARSTPKLMPPKKEGVATRVNRFGFRQPQLNRLSKVADLNAPIELTNNNNGTKGRGAVGRCPVVDANRNRTMKPPQAERFMLQSTQLPKPEPVRVIETKTAKTLANNSRKMGYHEDSSKEGSLTEDSGVGSQISGDMGVERLNASPTFGARRSFHKSRNLEIIKAGNTFDVRDLEDCSESCAPLPQLPSAFTENKSVYDTGFVREKVRTYQRNMDDNRRKISTTSSEGFSDDCEDKMFKDKFKTEKTFIKPNAYQFLKSDSNPTSSDEHEWLHGGEAMADEVSFSISSSDESKDKDQKPFLEDRNETLLFFEDSNTVSATNTLLLEDETSPIDSLISNSESDEILKRKMNRSSSNSKDINEKLTPPSPGTPTNASNSLSLSDGKDDFLIDDEIADQPALVFEDTLVADNNFSNNSESTSTMVDSTPKPKRKSFLDSPLTLRRKKLQNRSGSLDTLSPCESIASDDLMMDFDYSQSSGLEDDRNESHGFTSLDETVIRREERGLRDWNSLLGNFAPEKNIRSNANRSRLLSSRTGTPNSVPDSPKSVDGKPVRSRHSVNSSPLRLSKAHPLTGYDSDDSIRLDRANHSAMKQDIISVKTMLLKLRRVLNEQPDEDILLRSETHIPFDGQNGLFNGFCSEEVQDDKLELAELRKQILFLQGQLEDKEKTVLDLQEQVVKLATNSAPASVTSEASMCNAATQTERVRPISAGPSLQNDGNVGSLVSANESPRRSRPQNDHQAAKKTPSKLWRQPGEPPSPQQRYTSSSIPRRANSRTRTPLVPS